jgi:hypothetical protein
VIRQLCRQHLSATLQLISRFAQIRQVLHRRIPDREEQIMGWLTQPYFEQGVEKGIEQGRAEGQAEGQAKSLVRLRECCNTARLRCAKLHKTEALFARTDEPDAAHPATITSAVASPAWIRRNETSLVVIALAYRNLWPSASEQACLADRRFSTLTPLHIAPTTALPVAEQRLSPPATTMRPTLPSLPSRWTNSPRTADRQTP